MAARISVMAIIPARKGSKRIPGKNLAVLGGKPLVVRAIETALASDLQHVVVTTDDDLVLALCKNYSVATINRPAALCEDRVVLSEVVIHAMQNCGGRRFDAVCLMTPTAPLRLMTDVTETIDLLRDHEEAKFALTVTPYEHHPYYAYKEKEPGSQLIVPASPLAFKLDRVWLPTLWRPVAVCHAGRWDAIMQQKTIFGSPAIPHVVPRERAVDIDTPLDLAWARYLLGGKK